MREPTSKPPRKFRRRLRRIGLFLLIVGIAVALGIFYLQRNLGELMVTWVHREMPDVRLSIESVALANRNRIELRNLSLRFRQSNVEILRLTKATIDFSISGLRQRHLDAVTVDDPVVFLNDAALERWSANWSPGKKPGDAKPWTLGKWIVREGRAHLDFSSYPQMKFEFASAPRTESPSLANESIPAVQGLELRRIEITGRDKETPSQAAIKSIEAQFTMSEIATGRLRELIVRNPSLRLTPELMNYLPKKSGEPNSPPPVAVLGFRVDRLLIEEGDAQLTGVGERFPEGSFKFALDTTDAGLGDMAEKLHHAQLWEIALWPASLRLKQFLTIDSAQIDLTLAGMMARHELDAVIVTGMVLRAGNEFRSILTKTEPDSTKPGTEPEKSEPWLIRKLELHNGRVAVTDLGLEIPTVHFELNTKLKDVPLSPEIALASKEIQRLEFADFSLHSPLDPFVTVVNLKTVFVNFSFDQIMRGEIDALVLLNPTIYVGPDLFWYIDHLKKRQAETTPVAALPSSTAKNGGWRLNRFDAAYGQLVIANEGQPRIPLPFSFSSHAENLSFNNVSDLQLKLNLLIPTADYAFPDYQIELKQLGGEIKFGLPPEKQANNLVQTLASESVRWRQFTGKKLFWSVTYDEKGIYGQFGGAGYGGYLNGQFSFFFESGSPWQGWITGSKVDLGQFTDVIAPQNFRMTGPVDFEMNVKALSRDIQRLTGNFKIKRPGQMKIGKLDDLLAEIPVEWSVFRQDATRIGLETLRDFDYESGHGDFSFAGKTGKIMLKLEGPHGSRNFDVRVH